MRNYVQKGCTMSVPAPANTAAGDFVVAGSLFGVANTAAPVGENVEVSCGGVFDLPKKAGQAFTQFAPVYWDATAKVMTVTADANLKVGVAALPALAAAAAARVRLNDAF